MRLVVDTSVLVGELLRAKGRERLGEVRIELIVPEEMHSEVQVELPRRIEASARRRGLSKATADALLAAALNSIDTNVAVIDEAISAAYEDEARARSARDPSIGLWLRVRWHSTLASGPTVTSSARACRPGPP